MFTKSIIAALSVVVSALLAPGCAVNGHSPLKRSAPVKVATNPAGALAVTEYGDSCITPCRLRLLMSRGGAIHITKEGYEDVDINIGSQTSKTKAVIGETAKAAYYLDDPDPIDVVIDFIGTAADPEGQYRDLDTYSIAVNLVPIGGAHPEESDETGSLRVDENGVILLDAPATRP